MVLLANPMGRPARTNRQPPPAERLLRAWLGERTQDWLAGLLGVSAPAVYAWMSGATCPVLETAAVLERLTDGAVPASAWADPGEVERRVGAALAHM